jgi:hypothetical protein
MGRPADTLSYITKLPTFADRGRAIATRLDRIKADPKYKAMSAEKQATVRARFYDQVVPASYSGFKLPVPDKGAWVAASGRVSTFNGKSLDQTYQRTQAQGGGSDYMRHNTETGQDLAVGIEAGANGIQAFGVKATNWMFNKAFGLAAHFTHTPSAEANKLYQQFDTPRVAANMIAAAKARTQNYDYWFQTHPRDTVVGRLDGMIGEQIATLPIYEALDSGTLAKAGVDKFAPSLTTKLAATKFGTFVAKRLANAADGYLANLVTSGGNTQEAKAGAIGFAVGAPLIEGAAKLPDAAIGAATKIASAPLIKKWTADVLAMGGKPFAEELTQSAWHEMSPMAWWLQYGKEWGVTSAHAAVDGTKLGPELMMFPEAEGKGHFVAGDKVYRYATKETQQSLFDRLTKDSFEQRKLADPVMAKLHEAEKASLESIALAMFGKKNAELTDSQRVTVGKIRMTQISEAAKEAPAHLLADTKQEAEKEIQTARAANPQLNASMAHFEQKYGFKYAETEAAARVEHVKEQTGIKNSNVASTRLAGSTQAAEPEKITAEGYASHRLETAAYLRAPRNREQLVATLGPAAHENWAAFYDKLKAIDSSKLQYEKPEHRLLYLYPDLTGKGDAYSQYLARAVERRLKQTTEFSGLKNSEILEQAKRLHYHIYELARSGRLAKGSNVFRSTLLDGSHTKWQVQSSDETFAEITRAAEKSLKQHPVALKTFKIVAAGLHRDAKAAKTADEAFEFTRQLEDFSNKMLTSHAQIK